MTPGPEPTFDRHTIPRIKGTIAPFFRSEQKKQARLLLGLLLGFAIAVALVQVLMSYVARDFIDALTQRDREGGWLASNTISMKKREISVMPWSACGTTLQPSPSTEANSGNTAP
jgi:ABC-type uncharacterized transport system fused permease/ATPase subunit